LLIIAFPPPVKATSIYLSLAIMKFQSLLFTLSVLVAATEARVGMDSSVFNTEDEQQDLHHHRELLFSNMGGTGRYSDWASRCCGQMDNAACRCPIRNLSLFGNQGRWESKCAQQGFANIGELDDIIETAEGAGSFTTLVDLVDLAGLTDTLKSAGPNKGGFTVFAPNDDAFAKLPEATVAALTSPEGMEDLTSILTYHVVPGRVMADQLTEGGTATTVQGTDVTFSLVNGAKVDNSNIIATDILASNGIIHVIDTVLTPDL
jgi:uncharacterized surface protein with fasciclin (FAS1) repeats